MMLIHDPTRGSYSCHALGSSFGKLQAVSVVFIWYEYLKIKVPQYMVGLGLRPAGYGP